MYVEPEPSAMLVPQVAPCQYQVTPAGGVPVRMMVTSSHCGELLVGVAGSVGILVTVTFMLPQFGDQH